MSLRAVSSGGVPKRVGPTLGAASLLAAQGRDLPQVAASMLVFGIGAALPLLIIGLLSREALQRWRKRALAVTAPHSKFY